jgi:hypothetical protein
MLARQPSFESDFLFVVVLCVVKQFSVVHC